MKKLVGFLVGVALALLVTVIVAKNLIAKTAITGGVKAMTGLTLNIRSMNVGVLRSVIGIRGLTLHNPPGFPDPHMVELPELYVDYDLGAFFAGRVHLEEVRLHLQQFTVVKDAQGRLNLDALKVVQESKRGAVKPAPEAPKRAKEPELLIDSLHLKVGKVVYKDYAGGRAPRVLESDVNVDEHYQHITNPQMLAALVVTRALMHTGIARLTGLDLGALQSQVAVQLQEATRLVTDAAEEVVDVGKEAVGAASDAVQKTTDTLKKVLPFGD